MDMRIALYSAVLLAMIAGCDPAARDVANPAPKAARWITVVTPHNEEIRRAFATAFSDWHLAQRGSSVYFEWVALGTPECLAFIQETAPERPATRGRGSSLPDVFFGGGIADHRLVQQRGQSRVVRVEEAAKIPASVAGLPTRDADGHWHATGLSTFGIVFNERDCARRGIAAPTTWADLADPRFRGWLGLADPAASGSVQQSLLMIVQKEGWDAAWGQVIRMLANSRALVERSTVALQQTRGGVFLASFAVNFDGLALQNDAQGVVQYLNPPGATAATPDLVSVLNTTDDVPLAEDFVRFCLSAPGQMLWGARRSGDAPPLFHYPILPEVYEKHAAELTLPENPLKDSLGLELDFERGLRQLAALRVLIAAATGDNHITLQQTWEAVSTANSPAALAEFVRPPLTEAAAIELADSLAAAPPEQAGRMRADLAGRIAEQLEKTRQLLQSP